MGVGFGTMHLPNKATKSISDADQAVAVLLGIADTQVLCTGARRIDVEDGGVALKGEGAHRGSGRSPGTSGLELLVTGQYYL